MQNCFLQIDARKAGFTDMTQGKVTGYGPLILTCGAAIGVLAVGCGKGANVPRQVAKPANFRGKLDRGN